MGLGGNLGGPEAVARRFRRALDALGAGPLRDLRCAELYRTAPVVRAAAGGEASPQPDYLNTVAVGSLAAEAFPDADFETNTARLLVGWCKRLEQEAGRVVDAPGDRPLDTPRTLDVDLLLLGSQHLDLPSVAPAPARTAPSSDEPEESWWPGEIVVPHPRLRLRRFVLRPLCDLVPDLELPGAGGVTVRRALDELESEREAGGRAAEVQRVEVWRGGVWRGGGRAAGIAPSESRITPSG